MNLKKHKKNNNNKILIKYIVLLHRNKNKRLHDFKISG